MTRNLASAMPSFVTALALAGWVVLVDWWATTDNAVRDALREVRWQLDEQTPGGAKGQLDALRPLFRESSSVRLAGDPTLPFVFETVVVPPWRIAAGQHEEFAALDAEAAALDARYAELGSGSLAPVVRALGALDPALTDVLPYDPLPPAKQWVIYERPEVDGAAQVAVARANLRLDDALQARAAGPEVGFALRIRQTVELTGATRPGIQLMDVSIPAMPETRSVTWWILGRTEPIEVWGTFAVIGGDDADMAQALVAERTARLVAGPPAGSEERPTAQGPSAFLDNLCAEMGKPKGCFLTLPP